MVLEGGLTEPVRPREEVSPTFSQHDLTPPSWQPVWRANNRPTSAWISARCAVLPFFCAFAGTHRHDVAGQPLTRVRRESRCRTASVSAHGKRIEGH